MLLVPPSFFSLLCTTRFPVSLEFNFQNAAVTARNRSDLPICRVVAGEKPRAFGVLGRDFKDETLPLLYDEFRRPQLTFQVIDLPVLDILRVTAEVAEGREGELAVLEFGVWPAGQRPMRCADPAKRDRGGRAAAGAEEDLLSFDVDLAKREEDVYVGWSGADVVGERHGQFHAWMTTDLVLFFRWGGLEFDAIATVMLCQRDAACMCIWDGLTRILCTKALPPCCWLQHRVSCRRANAFVDNGFEPVAILSHYASGMFFRLRSNRVVGSLCGQRMTRQAAYQTSNHRSRRPSGSSRRMTFEPAGLVPYSMGHRGALYECEGICA